MERSENCLKIALTCPGTPAAPGRKPGCRNGRDLFRPRDHPGIGGGGAKTPKKGPAPPKKPLDMQKLQQQALEIFGGEWLAPTPAKEEPMKDLTGMMKQAQKLQAKMMAMQAELGNRTVSAQAGGGMVEAVVNGRQELLTLRIDPEVVVPRMWRCSRT